MEAKLRAGVTLVVDRYSYSGVAFTAAKKSPGHGLALVPTFQLNLSTF